jgi:hypothetical protein
LQERSPAVLGLLAPGGATETVPAFFRVRLDDFAFADPAARRADGRYWQVTPLPQYTIEGSLQGAR